MLVQQVAQVSTRRLRVSDCKEHRSRASAVLLNNFVNLGALSVFVDVVASNAIRSDTVFPEWFRLIRGGKPAFPNSNWLQKRATETTTQNPTQQLHAGGRNAQILILPANKKAPDFRGFLRLASSVHKYKYCWTRTPHKYTDKTRFFFVQVV
jgi:hypothetical protein